MPSTPRPRDWTSSPIIYCAIIVGVTLGLIGAYTRYAQYQRGYVHGLWPFEEWEELHPPLTAVGRRTYLAGRIENTPENMMQFIRFPKSVDEKTAMPETGVTERDARDMTAYLYTLR